MKFKRENKGSKAKEKRDKRLKSNVHKFKGRRVRVDREANLKSNVKVLVSKRGELWVPLTAREVTKNSMLKNE